MSKVSNSQLNSICREALANSERLKIPLGIPIDQISTKYIIYLYLIGYMSKDTAIVDGILYSATTCYTIPDPQSNQIIANALSNINLGRSMSEDEIAPAPSDISNVKTSPIPQVQSIQDVLYNLSLNIQYSKSKSEHYDLEFINSMFTVASKCNLLNSEDIDDLTQIYLLSILAIKSEKCRYLDKIKDSIYNKTPLKHQTITDMLKTKELLKEIDQLFQPIFQKYPDDIPDFLKSSYQAEVATAGDVSEQYP